MTLGSSDRPREQHQHAIVNEKGSPEEKASFGFALRPFLCPPRFALHSESLHRIVVFGVLAAGDSPSFPRCYKSGPAMILFIWRATNAMLSFLVPLTNVRKACTIIVYAAPFMPVFQQPIRIAKSSCERFGNTFRGMVG